MTYQVTNLEFIKVIEAHKRIIFKICNAYCKAPADREDLAQEIIYQLFRSWEKYDPAFKHSTWVYRVALNVAISFFRTNKRSGHTVLLGDTFIEIADNNNDELEENLRTLRILIQELKELDRALMILYLDDKSYKEIAAILGISESNVGTKVSRIKETLKQKFIQQNI